MTVTRRERRIATGRWSFRSTLVPTWLFWLVTCTAALLAGVLIGYVGSPKAAAPIEINTAAAQAPSVEFDYTSPEVTGEVGDATEGFPLVGFEGTGVQVLNATSTGDAADTMAGRLEAMGFDIQDIEIASREYQHTTVFWTRGEGRAAAEAIADHFGWRSGPKPSNLTSSIPVHIVVGEDEATP
jgi:hypothetical protein